MIRFLIITICTLYIIRTLVRWLLPALFKSVINKAQEQQRYQQNYQQQQYRQPDERVRVDYMPENKKGTVPDTEGEFVEYEEIKK